MSNRHKLADSPSSKGSFAIAFSLAALVAFQTTFPRRTAYADDESPQIRAAVGRAVAYLKKNFDKAVGGKQSLAALALLKGGEPPDSPEITKAIEQIQAKIRDGKYQPPVSSEQLYAAGVNINLLADANASRYRPEIEAIADYIISEQGPKGDWDYPKRKVGDTSMSQYGMLGFWAAERAGISMPRDVYRKAVGWHVRTQLKNGGFAYHPGTTDGLDRGNPSLSLTAAGTGSLLIARMYLLPNLGPGSWEQRPKRSTPTNKQPKKQGLKWGVLQKVDIDLDAEERRKKREQASSTKVTSFDGAIKQGLGWLTVNFRDRTTNHHRVYYYYTLERMAALANIRTIGKYDWFEVCAATLLKTQKTDGSFDTQSGPLVGTSFAIMFLTKSSAKLLRRDTPENLSSGLMTGNRGLPKDLSEAQMKDGRIVQQKITSPLDELLIQLANPKNVELRRVQQAIVHKVLTEDREALIGQHDRLLKLIDHPDVDVRRTALWALGRGGNLKDVRVVIRALEDNNVDVVVEARNALCWISRKPRGFDLPESPMQGMSEDASEAERQAAIGKWRSQVLAKWRQWYLKVRPYDERDDLLEAGMR